MLNLVSGRSDKVYMKKIYAISIPVLLIAALLAGCSGDLNTPSTSSTYRVDAILVKKMLPDSSAVFLTLQKNGADYKGAGVTLAGMVLDTNELGYVGYFGASQIAADTSYIINIKDNDSLDVDLTVSVPELFAINSPGLRFFTGGAESVSWFASTNADAYILATEPPEDTAVVYDGFEAYVATTTETIPPETFLDGLDRIGGMHYIHVAAYIGSPIDISELPFMIPVDGNPGNNVSGSNISGRLAGMVVAAPDSIFVSE